MIKVFFTWSFAILHENFFNDDHNNVMVIGVNKFKKLLQENTEEDNN